MEEGATEYGGDEADGKTGKPGRVGALGPGPGEGAWPRRACPEWAGPARGRGLYKFRAGYRRGSLPPPPPPPPGPSTCARSPPP